MRFGKSMSNADIRQFTATDRDWLVDQHDRLYAQSEGFDDSFGVLVAEILDDFIASHDLVAEGGWIAEGNGQRLGSIFCVRLSETTAKLRLLLLVPEARGKGLGRQMLATCMNFAKERGYRDMQLWTHESHAAACALYEAAGWELVGTKPVHSFGQDLVEQSWHFRF